MTYSIYIGLGSNLLDPLAQLKQALSRLQQYPQLTLLTRSKFYRSPAIGPTQPDYINAVAHFETTLSAFCCFEILLEVEQKHGRQRSHTRWLPRTLDLDMLLYGNDSINTPTLTIPHPEMAKRHFVLYPLAEIAPHLIMPIGTPLSQMLTACPPHGLTTLDE